jgi:TonB-dependent Receptor Plug Domain
MKKIFLMISLLAGLSAFRWADEGLFQKIINQLELYRLTQPQEKVYLHLDRGYYSLGDTLWYKAYLFEAERHRPDSASRVVHVELIEPTKGKIIYAQKLYTEHVADGAFTLPDTLREGVYQIRAYTNWMRNFPEQFFFKKEVKIWDNDPRFQVKDIEKAAELADVQFFPEGGYQVYDVIGRMGFKALNRFNKGIDVEGFIIENNKDTTVSFQSVHLGMGQFPFKPETGKTYKAFLKVQGGKQYQAFDLPAPLERGYAMTVDNLSSKSVIRVFVNHTMTNPEKPEPLMIVAHQRGKPFFTAKSNNGKRSFSASIPRSAIDQDGIVVITLFDHTGKPLCERLVMQNNNQRLKIEVNPDKASYKPYEKVTLNLQVNNAKGDPVVGNFSLAAVDANQVQNDPHGMDIYSYMLLCSEAADGRKGEYFSDIKGQIEQPSYYFDPNEKEAAYHLDVLLMTQGWRRFDWNTVMKYDTAQKSTYALAQGLSIAGRVLRPNGKVVEKPVEIVLAMTDKKNPMPQVAKMNIDKQGYFSFDGLDYSDSTTVLLQATQSNGNRDLAITYQDFEEPKVQIVKVPFNPIEIDGQQLAAYLKRAKENQELEEKLRKSQSIMMDEVTVKAKKKPEPDIRRQMYSQPESTVDVSDFSCNGFQHPLQLVQGRVAGLTVSPSGQFGFTAQIRGSLNFQGAVAPLYLIDGNPTDEAGISSISPCDIERVDVLKGASASMFGSRGGGGVINFLTKRSNKTYDWNKDKTPGTLNRKIIGFQSPRVFYAPNYEVTKPGQRPDFRTTLWWSPMIKTDEKGQATVTYWNSEARTNVHIQVEGASILGEMGVSRKSYRVE